MNRVSQLDAVALLERVAARIPPALRGNVVVIGSIAVAWAYRDVSGTHSVATKDIDLLLRPSVDAVLMAEALGETFLAEGWQPWFPEGCEPGNDTIPDDQLPALRLKPPEAGDAWFVELLAEPSQKQIERRHWHRFATGAGAFGLPSFRYMRVAVDDAEETASGLRIAKPAHMALAHLLEHAEPDTTPISSIEGHPPRFAKDVGRAVALWWLAREQSPQADAQWLAQWRTTLERLHPNQLPAMALQARKGLSNLADHLRIAHEIAVRSVLAPHGTTLDAYRRACASLTELIDRL